MCCPQPPAPSSNLHVTHNHVAVGASKDGAAGFAKGLAAGVVGAVVLPVAGVCVGTVQVVRGIANQPEAIMNASKGKVWDQVIPWET